MLDNLRKSKLFYPTVLFMSTFLIYVHNLSPSVYGGDSGDFITAALSRGVPHPSGYPLYTMLGIIFTSLPISATSAWKLGLLSSLLASLTVVIVYLVVKELTKNRILSFFTSLTLAFNYIFWLYAEIVEVFALNSLFLVILVYFTVKYINTREGKFVFFLAFFAGLSLTNNLTVLFAFPGILVSLLLTNKKFFFKISNLVKSAIIFFAGLVPYLYIPIAAKRSPLINWGKAVNFENFTALVLRRDYAWVPTTIKPDLNVLISHINTYLDYWLIYSSVLIVLLASFGFVYLIIKKKYIYLILLTTSFILFGPFFVVYTRNPFGSLLEIGVFAKFFIAGDLILILFTPFGVLQIQRIISGLLRKEHAVKLLHSLVIAIAFLIPVSSLATNFRRTNLGDVYIGDNYALDILSTLPQNSVLLLQGDNTSFNSLYLQIAYNIRPDVYIPGRPEGFIDILKEAGFTDEEIQAYTIENRSGIDREILASTIAPMLSKRPIFSDTNREMFDSQYGKIVSVPYGLLYKLEFEDNLPYAKEEYISEITKITSFYHISALKEHEELLSYNLILADIKKWYSIAYFRIGEYLVEEYDDKKGAAEFVQLAGELDPLISN